MRKMIPTNKKMLAFVLVMVLLIMTFPAAVMAKSERANEVAERNAARVHVEDAEETEVEEDDVVDADTEEDEDTDAGEKSERALQVALRNQWAEEMGISPGHANLIVRYAGLVFEEENGSEGVTIDGSNGLDYDDFIVDGKLDVKNLMNAIREQRFPESSTTETDE